MSTVSFEPDRASRLRSLVLRDGDVSVTMLNLGCITQDWQVPLNGKPVPVVLGFADPMRYLDNPYAVGAICGPVGNRISNASITLDGQTWALEQNEPPNHLHGGSMGVGHRIWDMDATAENAATFHLHSAHLQDGYPGNVDFQIDVTLDGDRLTYDMRATTDRPTVVNLAQHNYYSLGWQDEVWPFDLQVAGTQHTPLGPGNIPTGEIAPVDGTCMDFRTSRTVRDADPLGEGIDGCTVLEAQGGWPVAELRAPNGMRLRLWTDQPGLQLYSARYLPAAEGALPGQQHGAYAAFCLEPQHFADSPNQPAFPSIRLDPGQTYRQVTAIEIRPEKS